MEKMVYKAIIRYLKMHYPDELYKIVKRAKGILPDLKAKAPDIGGRENTLANNMDMFLLFLSFYEASDHRMAGEAIDYTWSCGKAYTEPLISMKEGLRRFLGIMRSSRKIAVMNFANAFHAGGGVTTGASAQAL
ncbi:MAG: DUF2263 domain-containing protein [Lachnospiraceae bacterium]|nr:DUF2263 domain-containing protein [Lachnospiraceae bacterium]